MSHGGRKKKRYHVREGASAAPLFTSGAVCDVNHVRFPREALGRRRRPWTDSPGGNATEQGQGTGEDRPGKVEVLPQGPHDFEHYS